MAAFPGWWALCGGWAADAWLGRQTRDHGDIDIAVFFDEERKLFEFLRDWNVVAHDGAKPADSEPWDGRKLVRRSDVAAHLHARGPGEENREALLLWVTPPHKQLRDDRNIEFVFNERERDEWLLNVESRFAVPIPAVVAPSPWGLPAVRPEIIAFYKATAYFGNERLWNRPHDLADFELLLPVLDTDARSWLRESIASLHADHPWLPQLE